jgi:hypothetical protein
MGTLKVFRINCSPQETQWRDREKCDDRHLHLHTHNTYVVKRKAMFLYLLVNSGVSVSVPCLCFFLKQKVRKQARRNRSPLISMLTYPFNHFLTVRQTGDALVSATHTLSRIVRDETTEDTFR